MGYIGFLATGTGNQRTDSTMIAQNQPAKATMGLAMQQEVAALRAHVQELTSREKNLSKKLSNIEEALGPNTAALPEQDTGFKLRENNPSAPMQPPISKATKNVSVNVLPLTPDDKIFQLSDKTAEKTYGIDLASARSIDSLERHWKNLKKSNPALLKGLKAHFIDKGTADLPLFTLVAGPFERKSAAATHCKMFSNANIDCQETHFQTGSMEKITTAGK